MRELSTMKPMLEKLGMNYITVTEHIVRSSPAADSYVALKQALTDHHTDSPEEKFRNLVA